jgi:hypothetical protein
MRVLTTGAIIEPYHRNCRWVTKSINANNRDKKQGCVSNFIGVAKNGISWQAYLYINRKLVYIGTYKNELDAALSRNNYIVTNNLPHKINIIPV